MLAHSTNGVNCSLSALLCPRPSYIHFCSANTANWVIRCNARIHSHSKMGVGLAKRVESVQRFNYGIHSSKSFQNNYSITLSRFKKCVSLFNQVEEHGLCMIFVDAPHEVIVGPKSSRDELPLSMQDLILEELDYPKILAYQVTADSYDHNDNQMSFFEKLSLTITVRTMNLVILLMMNLRHH